MVPEIGPNCVNCWVHLRIPFLEVLKLFGCLLGDSLGLLRLLLAQSLALLAKLYTWTESLAEKQNASIIIAHNKKHQHTLKHHRLHNKTLENNTDMSRHVQSSTSDTQKTRQGTPIQNNSYKHLHVYLRML